ncbi:MAG: flagellar motor switch protein FliM [Candidatus Hydrogenedentes bacterium]|nr:flagellar motor switch protein FliM [Candidatus Hydrogenedentota bacterium]
MADILSQDEVDLLLSTVSKGEAEAPGPEAGAEAAHLATYDFRRPERVSKDQLKGLQSLFEAFGREVSIALPPFLRTVVRTDLVSIDQLTYDEFVLSVARPTSLAIVNMAPLEGKAIIELNPGMVFPIVDRVLGGKGMALSQTRELTEIENRIVHRIMLMILDCLKRSWDQLVDFKTSVVAQESDPLIVQIVAGSEMVLLVGYEVHIGEVVGNMNVCIPLAVLGPILDQLSRQAHFTRKTSPEALARNRVQIERSLRKVLAPVDAVLGHARLPLQEIARLQIGDIVQLDSEVNDPIVIEVGGIPRFKAQPGRRREQSAVLLTALLRD